MIPIVGTASKIKTTAPIAASMISTYHLMPMNVIMNGKEVICHIYHRNNGQQ